MPEWVERIKNTVKRWLGIETQAEPAQQEVAPHVMPIESGAQDALASMQRAREQALQIVPSVPQPDAGFEQLQAAYALLKTPPQEGFVAGFARSEGYPPEFQANEFPKLAGNGRVDMLGANQAFYFTRTNRDAETLEEKVQLDVSKLRELMGNVYDNNTHLTLMLDADAVNNPARFAQKYLHLRTEPDAAQLQGRENELIARFLNEDGLRQLAQDVIREKKSGLGLDDNGVNALTEGFLQKNFRLLAVEREQALEGAVWRVDAPEGTFCAKQRYSANTRNIDRTFVMGTLPELEGLAQSPETATGQEAAEILSAVESMESMPKYPPMQQQTYVARLAAEQHGQGRAR
jgi:hypothetical protein